MNAIELLDIISTGETSKVQFKEELPHRDSVAQEIVAKSNSLGGDILLGVKDVTGEVTGLTAEQVESYDRVISDIADNLKPPVYLTTEVVKVIDDNMGKNVLVVHVQEGVNKPYKTAKGEIYVMQGSNKRLLTDNAELMRLFQNSGNLLADEMEVYHTSINDVDEKLFADYFKKEFENSFEERGLNFEQALQRKRVLRNNQLTLAGLLFFGKEPQSIKPALTIKAVSYFGNDIAGNNYRSKPKDLTGTIPQLFEKALDFLTSNLASIQTSDSFNSQGKLEISRIALEEFLQNALVHRDYFKNSPIRLLIFDNRIEIISPGKLPNSLTVEDIKYGNPVTRNNQLVAFSTHTLPFSGLGSGVKRAIKEEPNTELINDLNGEQFVVIIPRPEKNK
ncbi:MAG: putative DNA binding domain-containing protein [Sediminibacterium sp.]|uniref:RNA-binding domain-containing protein n=1 Tax=Sediminibacterium sp. TaxID=1917865 RepID=UPI0027273E98|nr:RNA-binding domain-containing protein [Sediminibacterium sp.]MDO8997315.1 putative DNA binding domain-containing protein [Sediminibacterium sp.]